MLSKLSISNFKCWQATGEINLAPLTVLFGSNSSGKSSIGQFLMLLKQSIASSDRKTVFITGTGSENASVDLGLPSDMVYNGNTNSPIDFSYQWKLDKRQTISSMVSSEKYDYDELGFDASVEIKDVDTQTFEVDRFTYNLFDSKNRQLSVEFSKKDKDNHLKRAYSLTSDKYDFTRSIGRAWDIPSPIRFYGFPDEAVAYYQNAGFLQNLNLQHEKLFEKVYYLGPLRSRAKRLYTWSGRIPESVGDQGQDTIAALLGARKEDRKINTGDRRHRREFEIIIANMLIKMGLIEEMKINRISDSRQDYEIKVRTKGSNNFVDIPDVGVGVSQVLPVITELFYAPPNSTIIMEQPELHLHPSAQAGLADVIIDAINAKEEYASRNIQLILETHSEHLLRRLQRRIAEGNLERCAFAPYFINTENTPFKLEALQVDIFGNINNWPKGFFGDLDEDIYLQAKTAITNRMNQRFQK